MRHLHLRIFFRIKEDNKARLVGTRILNNLGEATILNAARYWKDAALYVVEAKILLEAGSDSILVVALRLLSSLSLSWTIRIRPDLESGGLSGTWEGKFLVETVAWASFEVMDEGPEDETVGS